MTDQLSGSIRFRRFAVAIVGVALAFGLLGAAGCSKPTKTAPTPKPAPRKTGFGMGGVDQTVTVTRAALEAVPEPENLGTPESAVRSYLDWVSYTYRTSKSEISSSTMTPAQFVRVDAYNQMNLQKERLLDQTLKSLKFGKLAIKGSKATLPASEEWTYRYVSISKPGQTIEGPYPASYETTYTLLKSKSGWQVDGVKVKALGTIK